MIRVQREAFDVGGELARLYQDNAAAGGVCVFIGRVRDMSGDAAIQALTLEHYPGMTERQLAALEAEARRRWPLEASLIIHRYGRLLPGEPIVLVATAAAHRDPAFAACRFLIDCLKTTAPFWKAEETGEGRCWVTAHSGDDLAAEGWQAGEPGEREGLHAGAPLSGRRSEVGKTEAIIFDFDGVIVESSAIKTRAFAALYREHGAAVVEAAVAHHEAHGGISRRKKIRHIHREFLGIQLAEEALEALCRRFSVLVEDAVVECPSVQGAEAFLAAHHRQVPLFVVLGTPHDELLRIVARRGIGGYFTAIYGSPPEKPPTIRQILATHRLAPDGVVFVGDALTDHDAAAETGIRFLGRVAPGSRSPFPAPTSVIADLTGLAV